MAGQTAALPSEGGNIPASNAKAGTLPKLAERPQLPPGFSWDDAPAQPKTVDISARPKLPDGFTWDDAPKDRTFTQRYVTDPLVRGKNNTLDQTANVGGLFAGISTPEDFAKAVFKDRAEAKTVPMTPADQATMTNIKTAMDAPVQPIENAGNRSFLQAMATGGSIGSNGAAIKVATELAKNPGVIPIMTMESLPAMASSVASSAGGAIAGGAVGNAPGAVVGGALGAGLSSGVTEFSSSLIDYLEATGQPADEAALAALVKNPVMMADAKDYAVKRGIPVALFDALSAGMAGRFAKPVERLIGESIKGKLAGAGAEAIAQGAGGAAGEAGAQKFSTGQINDPTSVLFEALAELPGAPLEVAGEVAGRKAGERFGQNSNSSAAVENPMPDQQTGSPAPQDGAGEVSSPLANSAPFMVSPEDRAILRRTQVLDQDIDNMSQDEVAASVAEARASGYAVNQAMIRNAAAYNQPVKPQAEQAQPQQATEPQQSGSPQEAARNLVSNYDPSQGQNERAFDIAGQARAEGDLRSPAQRLVDDYRKPKPAPQPVEQAPAETPAQSAQRLVQSYNPAQGQNERAMDIAGSLRTSDNVENPAQRLVDGFRRNQPPPPTPNAPALSPAQQMVANYDPAKAQNERALDIAGTARLSDIPMSPAQQIVSDYKRNGDGRRTAPHVVQDAAQLDNVASIVNTEPTDAQKAAGNYQKAHIKVAGMDVAIENPKGSTRSGVSPEGKRWSVDLPAHYGYIKRSTGADGDQVDVYVGDNHNSKRVYIVDQIDPKTGKFDEHKPVLGVNSIQEARDLYIKGFSDGRGAQRIGAITPMVQSEFKKWVQSGDTKKPVRFGKPNVFTTPDGFPALKDGTIKKPDSITEFLAKQGGVKDERGDLAAIGLTNRRAGFVVGAGPLVRKNGMSLDQARKLAVEAGYLQDAGEGRDMPSQSYISDLLDALDEDTRTNREVFSRYDEEHAGRWRDGQSQAQYQDRYDTKSAMEEVKRILGVDVDPQFAQDIAEVMAQEGLDFDAAATIIDRRDDERLAAEPKSDVLVQSQPLIPFFGDENNEVFAGTTPRSSAGDGETGQAIDRSIQDGTDQGVGGGSPQDGPQQADAPESQSQVGSGSSTLESQPERQPQEVTRPTEEVGADNKPQLVIPGAERISQQQEAQRKADAALKPKVPQKDVGGLFGDDAISPQLFDKMPPKPKADKKPDGEEQYSQNPDGKPASDAAQFMAELSSNDEVFQYPRSEAKSLKGVFSDINPSIKEVGKVDLSEEDKSYDADKKTLFRTAQGNDFYVYERTGTGGDKSEIWMDVSRLNEGDGGNSIYSAVGNYAYNTGKVFIGDPAGLSDIALRRRTDAMISSALKFGTTDHLLPHPRQVSGDKKLGIPGIVWTDGDPLANLTSMIEASTASLNHVLPEIQRARYDFGTQTFRSSKGERLSDGVLDRWSTLRRVRTAAAGRNALKRGILFNTILRAKSGERSVLLEQALQQHGQFLGPDKLSGVLYSEASPSNAPFVRLSDKEKARIEGIITRITGIENVTWQDRIEVPNGSEAWGETSPSTAAGMYTPAHDAIVLALDTANERTAYHEAFHRLQNLFLNSKTKRLLANERDRLKQIVSLRNEAKRVAGMNQSELEAEAFAVWSEQMDQNKASGVRLHVGIRKVWQQIRNTISRIKNALNGMGYQTLDDVFANANSGETAKGKRENLGRTQDRSFSVNEDGEKIGPFGKVFSKENGDPSAAIDRLMSEQQGEVPAAFSHPEIGDIAFVYGNSKFGLKHIAEGRGLDFLKKIPDTLKNGRLVGDKEGLKRAYIVDGNDPANAAVIRLDWDGIEKAWLVTSLIDERGKFDGNVQQPQTSDRQTENLSLEVPDKTGQAIVTKAIETFKGDTDAQYSLNASADPANFSPPGNMPPEQVPGWAIGTRIAEALSDLPAKTTKSMKESGRYDRITKDDGESLADYTHRKLIDYLHPVKMMEQSVGQKLNDLNSPYLIARLSEGTTRHEIQKVDDMYVQPMVQDLAAVGASLEDLHNYMYAMHAPERNRVVGLRNEEGSDLYRAATDPSIKGASGMSTNEANAIIDGMKKDREKFLGIRRAASNVRAMLDNNLKSQLRNGLINQATYDNLTKQWRHYVPLRSEADTASGGSSMPSKSRGFDVRGDEFAAAVGRFSPADNVIVYAINQAEQSILRSERNNVGKAALRFINQFDPKGENVAQVYWSEDPKDDALTDLTNAPDVYKRVIGADGKVTSRKINGYQMKDDVLAAKLGGKTYYIQFKDPKVGLALKKMTFAEFGIAEKLLRKVSNWQSIINTRANPAFIPINLVRDIQTGAVLALSKGHTVKDVAKIISDIPSAWGALWRAARGKEGKGAWDGYLEEFKSAGGKISFDQFNTIEGTLKKLQKDMKAQTSQNRAVKGWNSFTNLIEDLNDTIENGLRLSVYAASRKRGQTAKEAAFDARDLTIDFQKKGEVANVMNAAYVFFNASIQGNYNVAKGLATSKKVRAAMGLFLLGGFMQGVANAMFAGDGDDGENAYEKLLREQPYLFERNAVFFLPGSTDYVTIPLGFGMNAFWHLGAQGHAVTTGGKDVLPAILDSTRVAVDAFNPMGSGSLANMVAPTVFDPMIDLLSNQNFAGNPIHPQGNPFDASPPPNSEQKFKSNFDLSNKIAQGVNALTGGDDVVPGAIDVYPGTLDYLWGFFTGGLGRFVTQSGETAYNAGQGDFQPKKTPFIRSFYGEMDNDGKRAEFYNQREAVGTINGQLESYIQKRDREKYDALKAKHPAEAEVAVLFKNINSARKKLSAQKKAIEGSDKPYAEKDQLLKKIEERDLELMNRARTAYRAAKVKER